MISYAIWNNKGGVGKSYLTFQMSCEYARMHPEKMVLVIDVCPQANASGMLLGGIAQGDQELDRLAAQVPLKTISGYIEDRIRSPYVNPQTGGQYVLQVCTINGEIPSNVYLVAGDEQLEIQANRVVGATNPGPQDAWRIVHQWFSDLIVDIVPQNAPVTVFFDCNPSFSIYTEMALSASDRLIVPFTADGSSKRAVRSLLALVYGVPRNQGSQQSNYYLKSMQFRITIPRIYAYVGNRLTQHMGPANAFGKIVTEIGSEIFSVWQKNPNSFAIHPNGFPAPRTIHEFKRMFQGEIRDANTASVVSTSLGKPIYNLKAGLVNIFGKDIKINQTQLDQLKPDIEKFVQTIE